MPKKKPQNRKKEVATELKPLSLPEKASLSPEQIFRLEEQLRRAIIAGRTAKVRALLQSYPWLVETTFEYEDIHQIYSPLHLAAIYGRLALINLLIVNGADVLARTRTGRLPLYYAASYPPPPLYHAAKMTRALLEAMQKAIPDEKQQAVVLVETIAQLLSDVEKGTFSLLVLDAAKANLDAQDALGRSPLHHAVLAGNIDAFDMLYELGVEADPADQAGDTPLHLAVWSGSVAMVAVVLKQECEPLHRNDAGISPYAAALNQESAKIIGLFHRHPDVRAYLGKSLLGNLTSNDEHVDEEYVDEDDLRDELREHYSQLRERHQGENQSEERQNPDVSGNESAGPNEWFWEEEEASDE